MSDTSLITKPNKEKPSFFPDQSAWERRGDVHGSWQGGACKPAVVFWDRPLRPCRQTLTSRLHFLSAVSSVNFYKFALLKVLAQDLEGKSQINAWSWLTDANKAPWLSLHFTFYRCCCLVVCIERRRDATKWKQEDDLATVTESDQGRSFRPAHGRWLRPLALIWFTCHTLHRTRLPFPWLHEQGTLSPDQIFR